MAKQDCMNGYQMFFKLLNDNGFTYVWENPLSVDVKYFVPMDCLPQSNMSPIEMSPSLFLFSMIKKRFHYENYLDLISCNLTIFLCRIRTSSHCLRIEAERFNRNAVPRNERICLVCNNGEIEDEFHSILKCP